jgi:hypothetical protein
LSTKRTVTTPKMYYPFNDKVGDYVYRGQVYPLDWEYDYPELDEEDEPDEYDDVDNVNDL